VECLEQKENSPPSRSESLIERLPKEPDGDIKTKPLTAKWPKAAFLSFSTNLPDIYAKPNKCGIAESTLWLSNQPIGIIRALIHHMISTRSSVDRNGRMQES
jgi:hypothetical protein